MKRLLLILMMGEGLFSHSQPPGSMTAAAGTFLRSLSSSQRETTQFPFDHEERYNWHYIPRSRKGIALSSLSDRQRKAAMDLLRTGLSDTGYNKTTAIIGLEDVLRRVEGRPEGDKYRNPGNYYFSIFGTPAKDSIWGWRLEGHHISFNFSSANHRIASGTPGFLGTNPAVVPSGPEKGRQVLKEEMESGLAFFQSLDAGQQQKAILAGDPPSEIVTGANRKAMIDDPRGIRYAELDSAQQHAMIRLLEIYIHRYTRLFAMDMMNEIAAAGWNNLRFAWAGEAAAGPGHPNYYRLQGPTILIEYDNTQNNANHVHTVIRDLKNDFGGDELLEHYRENKH